MKKIIFVVIFISLFFSFNVYSDDIYTYKDKNGVVNVTDGPVPEKYEKKAKKVENYNRDDMAKNQKHKDETNNSGRNFSGSNYTPKIIERSPRTVYVGGGSSSDSMTKTERSECNRDCDMELHTCQSDSERHGYSYTSRDTRTVARSEGYYKETCQTNYRSCKSGCR